MRWCCDTTRTDGHMRLPVPVCWQMQSVEASMRLDAVASAGMGMSRGKVKRKTGGPHECKKIIGWGRPFTFSLKTLPPLQVKDMIEGGDVLVNWKEVSDGREGGQGVLAPNTCMCMCMCIQFRFTCRER